ncbi:MAG: Rieske 2Fe-2S domain-containing protein [Nitrososphaeraceae archaeon]|jgi:nitrite reductase/ring-hydroxylating ferredoxin subunit
MKICNSDDIKDNSMNIFTINNKDILVGRRNGKLFACSNSCPHRGASLSKGHFDGDKIVCYMHGYEYNIFTGMLENMKSWKKEDGWMEQSHNWRKSDDLRLYKIDEHDEFIFIDSVEPI